MAFLGKDGKYPRSYIIDANLTYRNPFQIIDSENFSILLKEILEILDEKDDESLGFFKEYFLIDATSNKIDEKYDIKRIIDLILILSFKTPEYIYENYGIDLLKHRKAFLNFIEILYNHWRNKHRFIIKKERYTSNISTRLSTSYSLIKVNNDFKDMVRDVYRQVSFNTSGETPKVLRQLPSGAQVSFLADKMRVPKNHRFKNQWLYEPLIVWNVIFEPPVIFYTLSNKRQGIFPVKKRNILSELKLPRTQWLCIPINVGRMLFYIYVHMEFLALGAGVTNLFEIADMKEVMTKKPDGIVIFGVSEEMIGDDEKRGAVFIDEEENMIVGVIPFSPENDYFGYMKKNTLTVHNLKVIEKGNLPVHGALARVRLVNGKSSYILLVGDSGAGKSETLEALNRYQEVSTVDIIFDDMGSLEIHDGKVVAFGTEVGAFVRLDDLPPGYAYSTIDRSVFMNPDSVNARVIVPFNNFSEIIKPSRIDYVFYANNYTKVSEGEDEIRFFKNVDEALEVFSKGARMAKGTTHERGITTSYFANPFGAIQMREKHHEIAIKFFNQMFKTGIKIGELKTSLGIPGYEYEGPLRAAKRLIKLINEGK